MVVKAKSSKGGSEMRKSLFAKLGIFGLAAIFLLSMASISADQMKTQGKPVKPPKPDDAAELYRVSISINGGGPGFATNMRVYPDKALGMVIMANGTYLPSNEILDLLTSLAW